MIKDKSFVIMKAGWLPNVKKDVKKEESNVIRQEIDLILDYERK
ncbi:MAG: hypothetical protein QXT63_01940 [Thermoplasmata archaeon]